ncbi:hypothetical protein HELRODRAFT_72945, partial [Helobdella robusta]|uniref:K Homology domain-containing protein n=1 Tax=Helobdella robusta TaxID=6412 RepID=T1G176_HELRO
GSKIKELRAKTGTYIKTPVKGEPPIFIITGRKEGIEMAKKEILAISDYFNQIRNSRLGNTGSNKSSEEVHIRVSVPYDVVGLLVGPKGNTIKKIQQETQTYIVTPNRDHKPIFQISGSVENVEKAKNAIKSYVWQRTG